MLLEQSSASVSIFSESSEIDKSKNSHSAIIRGAFIRRRKRKAEAARADAAEPKKDEAGSDLSILQNKTYFLAAASGKADEQQALLSK